MITNFLSNVPMNARLAIADSSSTDASATPESRAYWTACRTLIAAELFGFEVDFDSMILGTLLAGGFGDAGVSQETAASDDNEITRASKTAPAQAYPEWYSVQS